MKHRSIILGGITALAVIGFVFFSGSTLGETVLNLTLRTNSNTPKLIMSFLIQFYSVQFGIILCYFVLLVQFAVFCVFFDV